MEIIDDAAIRREKVVKTCLKVFIKKGLLNTTSRDLSAALNLQNAGIYYYFKSKDDLVVACAAEAALQLETKLLPRRISLSHLDDLTVKLRAKCDKMAPLMRFLVQTFTVEQYKEKLRPVLEAMSARYKKYAETIALRLHLDVEETTPYIYMGITAATDYMIFGDVSYIKPQFDMIKSYLKNEKGSVSQF